MSEPNAKQLLTAPGGGDNFGEINSECAQKMGASPSYIRLQQGYQGPKGYGNRHVENYPDRVKQIKNLGYSNFCNFAYDVASKYQKVGRAKEGRFFLIYQKSRYDLRLVVDYTADDGGFWNIITGLPYRKFRCEIVCEVTRAGGSEPTPDAADQRPRFATLSLPKTTPLSGNGS